MTELSKSMQLMHIFEQQPLSRTLLQLSYLCLLQQEQDGTFSISIELSAGIKKGAIITQPYHFLDAVLHSKPFAVSRSFRFDPQLHQLDSNTLHICQLLWQQMQYFTAHGVSKLKLIPVQGSLWQQLEPLLLREKDVQLQYYVDHLPLDEQRQHFQQLQFSDAKLPITLRIESTNGQYVLNGEDLLTLLILPSYGLACLHGCFYRMSWEQCNQVHQLNELLKQESGSILLDQATLSHFIVQAIPKLQGSLRIHVADDITRKMSSKPLHAAIYLDRIRDRVFIGVEFQYGSLTIQPFQPHHASSHDDYIMLRERDKENEILLLLHEIPGVQTEGGIIVEGDEDEYHFFSVILPKLKALASIHATTAIKLRYVSEQVYPKLSLTWEQKNDWLKYSFSMTGISDDELKQLLIALVEKRKFYRLSQGTLLSLEHPQYESLLRVMSELGLSHPPFFDDQISIQRAIPTMLSLSDSDSIALSRNLKQFVKSLKQPEHFTVQAPEGLAVTPRDYQLDGYQWMCNLAQYRLGGILADEMGLGKTLQAIMFLAAKYNEAATSGSKMLIVAPASLIYNWESELKKFAPTSIAAVIEANMLSFQNKQTNWDQAQLWIISYQTLRMHTTYFQRQHYHTIICDEAQAFKNDYTKTAQSLRTLSASYRFALTGTPIENRLEELLSILGFVNPELFGNKQKWLDLRKEKLTQVISPFILRRTKAEVLQELPPKYESTYTAPLTMEQKKLYLSYLAKLQEDSLKRIDPKKKGEQRIKLLAGITRLRQICCHPKLFIEDYKGDSAKLNQLLQLVEESISSGRRILIFSQFTTMLKIIATELELRGYTHFYLDGSTPPKERLQSVDTFNQGQRQLFLLSLKAGGTGLNLTGADTVILYDLWWNPAVEQQAADRVHRIGQQMPVHIIRLVAEGTVEDTMIQLQARKQKLIGDILDVDSISSSTWTEEELMLLLDQPSESIDSEDEQPIP